MQIVINGLQTGLAISLMALAFTVVYLPTRVFHIALGAVYTTAASVGWACVQRGLPWYLAVVVAVSAGTGAALLCELLNHAPLERKHASVEVHLLSSLGIYIAVVQLLALVWGNESRVLRTDVDAAVVWGGAVITRTQLATAGGTLSLLCLFYVWLQFSNRGLQLRALSDNPTELALRGYDIGRLRLVAFGFSGLLGSAAGLLSAYETGFSPHAGLHVLLLAVVASIIGGRTLFWGPVTGGIVLGIAREGVTWVSSARWQEAITFALLVMVLYARPGGLLGRDLRTEAEA